MCPLFPLERLSIHLRQRVKRLPVAVLWIGVALTVGGVAFHAVLVIRSIFADPV